MLSMSKFWSSKSSHTWLTVSLSPVVWVPALSLLAGWCALLEQQVPPTYSPRATRTTSPPPTTQSQIDLALLHIFNKKSTIQLCEVKPGSSDGPPRCSHKQEVQLPEHAGLTVVSSNYQPMECLQNTHILTNLANLISTQTRWCCWDTAVLPEQHFWAAMLRRTSVHLGEAILDWIALEETTRRKNTKKSPRCSSAVCVLRNNATSK